MAEPGGSDPDLLDFIKQLGTTWKIALGGGSAFVIAVSLISLAIPVQVPIPWLMTFLAVLGLRAAYDVWRVERRRSLELDGKLNARPALRAFFRENEPSCRHVTGPLDPYALRIGISNYGGRIAEGVTVSVHAVDPEIAPSLRGRRFPAQHSGAREFSVPVNVDGLTSIFVDVIGLETGTGRPLLNCAPPQLLMGTAFELTLAVHSEFSTDLIRLHVDGITLLLPPTISQVQAP